MRISVQVLPLQAKGPAISLFQASKPLSEPIYKYLDFAAPECTIDEFFKQTERNVKEYYLNQSEYSKFAIKKLQDEDGNDLSRHIILGDLVPPHASGLVIRVIQDWPDRESSVPPSSGLRPTGFKRPFLPQNNSNKRRKIERGDGSVDVLTVRHPDQPVRSRERDTAAENEVCETSIARQASNHHVLNSRRNVIVEDSQDEPDTTNVGRYSEPKSESPEHDSQRLLSYPLSNNGDQDSSPELGAEENSKRNSATEGQFVKPILPTLRPRLNQVSKIDTEHDFNPPDKSYAASFPPNPFSARNTPDRCIPPTPDSHLRSFDSPRPDVYDVPATDDEHSTPLFERHIPGDERDSLEQRNDRAREEGNLEPSDSRTSMLTPGSFRNGPVCDFSPLNGIDLGNGHPEVLRGTQKFMNGTRTETANTSLEILREIKRNREAENDFDKNSSSTTSKPVLQSPANADARPITAKMNLERLEERRRNRKEKEDLVSVSGPITPKPVIQSAPRAGSNSFVKPRKANDPISSDSDDNAAKIAEEKRLRKNEQRRNFRARAKAERLKGVTKEQNGASGSPEMLLSKTRESGLLQGSGKPFVAHTDTIHTSEDQHQPPMLSKETAPGTSTAKVSKSNASFPQSSKKSVKIESQKILESGSAAILDRAAKLADEAAKGTNTTVTRIAKVDDYDKQAGQAYERHIERQKNSKERQEQQARTMAYLETEEQKSHNERHTAHTENGRSNENGGYATLKSTNPPHIISGVVGTDKAHKRLFQKSSSQYALRSSTGSAYADAARIPVPLLPTDKPSTTANKDHIEGPGQSLNRDSTTSSTRRSVSINPVREVLDRRSSPTSGTPTKSCLKKSVSQPIVIVNNSTRKEKEETRLKAKGHGSLPDLPNFSSTSVENVQAAPIKLTSKEKAPQAQISSQETKAHMAWQPPIKPPNEAGSDLSAYSKIRSSVSKLPGKLESASPQPSAKLAIETVSPRLSRSSSMSMKLQQKLPFSGTVKEGGVISKVTKGKGKESLGFRPVNATQMSPASIAISSDSSSASEQCTLISSAVHVEGKASDTISQPSVPEVWKLKPGLANLENVAANKQESSSGMPQSSTALASPLIDSIYHTTRSPTNPQNNSQPGSEVAKMNLGAPATTRMSIDSDRAPARYMTHSPSASVSSSEGEGTNNSSHASHSQQTNGYEKNSDSDDEDEDGESAEYIESDHDSRLSRPQFQNADDELEDALQRDARLSQKLVDRCESTLPSSIRLPTSPANLKVQLPSSSLTSYGMLPSQKYEKRVGSSGRPKGTKAPENRRTSEAPVLTHAKSAATSQIVSNNIPPSTSNSKSAPHNKNATRSLNNQPVEAASALRAYWTYQQQPCPPSTSSSESSTQSQSPPNSAQRRKAAPPSSQSSLPSTQTKPTKLLPTPSQIPAKPLHPRKEAPLSKLDDTFPVTDSSSSSEDSSHHTSDDGYSSEDNGKTGGPAGSLQQNGGGSKSVKTFLKYARRIERKNQRERRSGRV